MAEDLEDLSLGQPCPFPALVGKSNCRNCDLGDECRRHAARVLAGEPTDKDMEMEEAHHKATGDENEVEMVSLDDFRKLITLATSDPAAGKAVTQSFGGVTIVRERLKDGRTWQGRASCELPTTAVSAADLFWDFDRRRKWDGVFQEMRIVETYGDQSETVNMAIKTPPFVAPRDFVQTRRRLAWAADETVESHQGVDWTQKERGDAMHCVGVVFLPSEHEGAPPRDGYVRGTVHFSGIYVEDLPLPADADAETKRRGRCRFVMVSTTDFGGVPLSDWIVGTLVKLGAKLYFSTFTAAINNEHA